MKHSLFALMLASFAFPVSAQESRTWTGKWNNRKFGTSGPLQCVAKESEPGRWQATFTGTFQGDPFEYQAMFESKASSRGLLVGGNSTIRGHKYDWTGVMNDRQLRGQYRNNVGYNGEFVLSAVGSRSNPSGQPSVDPIPEIRWDPLIQDGESLLFVGNSFMANEGGVRNYLVKALKKRQLEITTDEMTIHGEPLKGMLKPEVAAKMDSSEFDSVIITSGDLKVMKQFDTRIQHSNKKTIVFMTWEPKHLGNGATERQYTGATKRAVRDMRRMERNTNATIIPSAVVFHDLTVRPPQGMPRVDYLWRKSNDHQNELGTMVNAWMLYAILTGDSPVGVNFDMAPFVVGQKLQKTPELRLDRELRSTLQQRVWQVAQAWKSGKSHLE